MTSIQSIIGYLMMISGVIYGFASANYVIVFIGIFAGLVLTSLAKVVEHLLSFSWGSINGSAVEYH